MDDNERTARPAGPLEEKLAIQGDWLFRWRSFVPMPLLLGLLPWMYLHGPSSTDPHAGTPWTWEALCVAIGFAGLAVRVWVAGQVVGGTSGRTTRRQVADALNTTGPYSVVRNPLYFGNFLMWMSVALFSRSVAWVAIAAALFWFCYERIIIAEERFLRRRFGAAFVEWAARTPAVIPGLNRYVPSQLGFSWRTALRREYSGLFGLVLSLALLEAAEELAPPGPPSFDLPWEILLAVAVVAYFALRFLKRHTRLLSVAGR